MRGGSPSLATMRGRRSVGGLFDRWIQGRFQAWRRRKVRGSATSARQASRKRFGQGPPAWGSSRWCQAAPRRPAWTAGDAHGEALHGAGEREVVLHLHDQVDVIRLHGELREPHPQPLSSDPHAGREHPLRFGRAEVRNAVEHLQRHVHRRPPEETLSPVVRHPRPRPFRLSPRPLPLPAPTREDELRLFRFSPSLHAPSHRIEPRAC